MWRDPSPMFPGDVHQRAGSPPSSSPSPLVGRRPQAVASPVHGATAKPSTGVAADKLAGAPSLLSERNATSAPASPFLCAVLGCEHSRVGGRYCEPHAVAFRDRAYDLVRDVGRGEMDS